MADHQPGVRAQNADVIRRRARVRWPHPDIHQCDPRLARPLKVVRRHLRQFRRRVQGGIGVGDDLVAGAHKSLIPAVRVRNGTAREGLELVHIKLVVGEQHMVLEMLWIRRGVMRQPRERIVHPLRGKRRQGPCAIVVQKPKAVHDVIVGGRQIRHVEDIAQHKIQNAFLRHRQIVGPREGEMHRHRHL